MKKQTADYKMFIQGMMGLCVLGTLLLGIFLILSVVSSDLTEEILGMSFPLLKLGRSLRFVG